LPESFQSSKLPVEAEPEELVTLEALQQRYLLRVLECVGGNKAKAAEILGVGRNTVYQMLSRMRAGGAPVYDSYSRA
jgi:two-component system response regulator HydG